MRLLTLKQSMANENAFGICENPKERTEGGNPRLMGHSSLFSFPQTKSTNGGKII